MPMYTTLQLNSWTRRVWSHDAHWQIIWNALHPCGVSNSDIWAIQQGSDFADNWAFQGGEYSYMHAMASIHQTPAAAVSATGDYVQQQMADAITVFAAGGTSQALFLFGTAMHPLMDMTSPAHHDASGLPRPWCGVNPLSCSNLLDHALLEDVNALNMLPHVQEQENAIIRGWYEVLTGKPLECNGCKQGAK